MITVQQAIEELEKCLFNVQLKLQQNKINAALDELAIKYKVDTYLRSCQKVVSYFALVVDLYSNSNERKEVEEQRKDFTLALTEHIRSFL